MIDQEDKAGIIKIVPHLKAVEEEEVPGKFFTDLKKMFIFYSSSRNQGGPDSYGKRISGKFD